MAYGETKVYFDGSHYIAIPHTEKPYRKRRKPIEEEITVTERDDGEKIVPLEERTDILPPEKLSENAVEEAQEQKETKGENTVEIEPAKTVVTTKKQLFDKFYAESLNMPKSARKRFLTDSMRPFFKDAETTENYVMLNMERRYRNLVTRRIRLIRKVNLQNFNYFVTFTYNDAIHTERSFRDKLQNTLSHFCSRKGWKYIGVWERSPEKKRLHFHGIFFIPDGTMPGRMEDKESYSFSEHKRQITWQNDYFNTHFGRNNFRRIETRSHVGEAVAYILKYIEKSGEKIVYSRGLPQFFISDIMDEDIAAPFGLEDKKLLLFDDFICWDEGLYMGEVSQEVISQMRKSN